VLVNHQPQALELARRVDTVGPDDVRAVLHQPDIQVAPGPLRAIGAELDVCDPVLVLE
jgi:hypothetical protein